MPMPSITVVLSTIFTVYVAYSIWTLSQLFTTLQCTSEPCYRTILTTNPKLQMNLFTSVINNPLTKDVTKVAVIKNFNYREMVEKQINIDIPKETRKNGTMFLHLVLVNEFDNNGPFEWSDLKRDGMAVIQRIALTDYVVPKAATFNLIGSTSEATGRKSLSLRPVSHWKPKVFVSILTDNVSMSNRDIPPEMARLIRITRKNELLPIIQNDFLRTRINDLIEITENSTKLSLTFTYNPISIGKLRLILHVEHALRSLKQFGFSRKDVDEVKGIFSETNLYLLCGTMFIGSIHVLFDFLSFKNDIAFWRRKKSYAGLSIRTTIWRAFSQIVIFLYLLDEHTSMLVLIPAGIGTIIELWKSKKILKLEISWSGIRLKKEVENKDVIKAEERTKEIDREGMLYLSYLLYPLCLAGAIYSLLYQPHKSWYSWTLNSLVNGVYAFGFLFMLPQLFVNYKLKSVAALPWRSFMYKAFNTFIDDIFAFIITMPTAHRLACFRDDIVFLIYLYQRWLYPVDKTRFDDGTNQIAIVELVELDTNAVNEENNGKLTKKTKKAKKID